MPKLTEIFGDDSVVQFGGGTLERSHCYCLYVHTSFTLFFLYKMLYIVCAFTWLLFFYSYMILL